MDQNSKQLAVERIKNSANILVTVGNNPEVDGLSALIGFTLLLGKLNKHASAVFSGQVPPAIDFLQPNTRLEKDVASLRDFIIALDKSKADKLRYKVEDNVVKIFITPYKSRISQADLTFSEGDFNVDTVVALGVSKRDDLDNAIKAHGRILHDAAVITVNAGAKSSDLGAIDWQDPAASSLCEMLVSISESFGSGLLDEQISTAFLTGIVAATDRFSNSKTSPKVMTMSAQLMAAGANQQLISNNLQVAPVAAPPPLPKEDDSQISIDHSEQTHEQTSQKDIELPAPQAASPPPPLEPLRSQEPLMPSQQEVKPPVVPTPPLPAQSPPPEPPKPQESPVKDGPPEKSIKQLEDEIAKMASSAKSKKKQLLPDKPRKNESSGQADSDPSEPKQGLIGHSKGHGPREIDENPMLGGTFNATSQQAHEDNVSDIKDSVNSTLLNHPGKPLDEEDAPGEDRPQSRAPDLQPVTLNQFPPESPAESDKKPILPPQPDAEAANPPDINVDDARKAVEEAMNSQSFNPSNNPLESINSQPLPTEEESADQEISIDPSGNLQQPGQTTTPPPGDTNQEFKLPS
ncbi:MAG TPA: hypothetical protein VF996_03510 [Candidatus Saccharimonadales bacterium]